MKIAAAILASLFVAATGLSLLRLSDWWVRACDFPLPQIAVSGLGILLLYLLRWNVRSPGEGALLLLLALALVYQGLRMLPYTPLYPKQVVRAVAPDPDDTLSILISNVYMENRESAPLLELVDEKQPDVVLLVETDGWWEEELRAVESSYPYAVKHPLPNTYGMLLYSRLELVDPTVEFLFDEEIPSVHADLRLPSGRSVRFHGVHPRPPAPTEAEDTVERDGELLTVAKRVAAHPGPSIVSGDLNDVAWSASTSLMQRIGGLLDPRIGRGLYSTFHAGVPFVRWPLDHVFLTDHFQLVDLERLGNVGSDHFPVFVRLALTPEAEEVQEAPRPTRGDLERAGEAVEEAREEASDGAGPGESPTAPSSSGPG